MSIVGENTTIINREPWTEHAECRKSGPDDGVWFPEKTNHRNRAGKNICDRCIVRAECLDYALTHKERAGIWGGLNTKERNAILALQRRAS